jgi:5'(3')-deoxyribonucleotidase
MDDVMCDFKTAFFQKRKENPAIKYPQSTFDFFRKLKPIPNSIQGYYKLLYSKEYEPYFLTSPSILNPLCYTEKRLWIEDNINIEACNRLIISPNKGLLKGEYLIDDRIKGNGKEEFTGEIIHFGSDKFKDWKTVLEYLKV